MLLSLLLMAAPAASVTVEGADPVLKVRLEQALLPLWRRTLDAERVTKRVKAVFLRSGRFLTDVQSEVKGQALRVVVAPSKQARVLSVRFLGNSKLSDAELGQAMFNRVDSTSARMRGLGRFLPEALTDDVTGLRAAYYAKGYIFAQVDAPRVTVAPDLKGVRLEVRVREGALFRLGKLNVTGLPEGERFAYQEGKPFSVSGIHGAVEKVRRAWMERGHALVKVKERSAVDQTAGTVTLWLDFVPGPICTIESIAWRGVQAVEPGVLLRLMRVQAGDRYDHRLLLEEIGRLRSRGLIQAAQVVAEPGSKPDRVRVALVAQDAMQRWFPAFTVTYLPGEGSVLLFQITTPNLLGKGIRFRGSSWFSAERRLFDISVGVPALLHPLDNGTLEGHNRDRTWPAVRAKSRGGSLGYGRHLDRRRRVSGFVGLSFDHWETTVSEFFDAQGQPESAWRLGSSASLNYDDRDSGLLGTKGQRLSLSLSFAPQVGDALVGSTRWGASAQRLQRLPFGLRARAQIGARGLIGAHQPQDRLYAGGPGTLRGFFSYAVAPRAQGEVNVPVGGDKLIHGNVELGYGLNSVLEPFVFVDAANAYHPDQPWFSQPSSPRPLHYGMAWSWGFGLLLRLPVLPFRFEWGRPITRGANDPEMLFSLGIGTG